MTILERDTRHALAVIAVTTNLSWGTLAAPLIHVEARRRSQRVTLLQPIAAHADNERAYVVDASVNGVRLSHSNPLAERKPCAISLEWHGMPIEFTAELRWSKLQGGKYQSGFEIQTIDPASSVALRGLVEAYVDRMLLYDCGSKQELVAAVRKFSAGA